MVSTPPPFPVFSATDDCANNRIYAFLGFGALGHQIAGLFLTAAEREQAIFFDDVLFGLGTPGSRPFAEHIRDEFRGYAWIVGLGYKHLALKQLLVDKLLATGCDLPVLVHGSAHVHASAVLGPGVIVYPLGNIDQGVRVEAGALLNNSAVVSHDSVIGKCGFLSPGVVLAGGVWIGARCFLGAGSVVANGIRIGAGSLVGIGSVVTRDVPPATQVIGNPARVPSRPLTLK